MSINITPGFVGSFRFDDDGLIVENPAATFAYTIQAAAIAADRVLNLPLITATDTLVTLGLAGQIFTVTIDTQIVRPSASLTYNIGTNARKWNYIYAGLGLQINANQYAFQVADTTASGLFFNNTVGEKAIELHIAAAIIHKFWMGSTADDGAVTHASRTTDPTNATANGIFYIFDNGANNFWMKMRSNSLWVDTEQRETISVTPGATVTLTHNTHTNVYAKWTAGENETVNASGTQVAHQRMVLLIVNDATSARTITFGTGFKPSGTIVGTVSKTATIQFVSDGTNWYEVSRTLAL